MAQTQALVRARLPDVLASIVLTYFKCRDADPCALGVSGECEELMAICARPGHEANSNRHRALRGVCTGGHIELVRMLLDTWVINLDYTLPCAYANGHRDIAWLLINHKRDTGEPWLPFSYICAHGMLPQIARWVAHMSIVRLDKHDWNAGLSAACLGGQVEVMRDMAARGATMCLLCGRSPSSHAKHTH